jgi:hypothetical protein
VGEVSPRSDERGYEGSSFGKGILEPGQTFLLAQVAWLNGVGVCLS